MKFFKKTPKRLTKKKESRLPLFFAFVIPFLCMMAVIYAYHCVPLGRKRGFLYCDEYHQYYPFFLSFRNALRNGESLVYNWDVGMGVDNLGLIAYYLGSPLNLIGALVPDNLTLHYFTMLVPIRLGLAGLFFAIFLKKIFNKNDMSIAVFGAFYGLCAWALSYQWNVMWLDTFALLPLVVLGTIRLLRDKKVVLYTVSLFFSVASNYYIGFFTCIFTLLVFICYEICRWQGLRRFLADLGRIALFSMLAIGMTAFLTLPAFIALQTSSASDNQFPSTFQLNIANGKDYVYTKDAWKSYAAALSNGEGFFPVVGKWFVAVAYSFPPILDGMYQTAGNMTGGMAMNFKEADGLPNIYCGTVTIVLAFLFLCSNKVRLRDKICSICLLVFLMLSFIIRQLDYMWHGFHFPNMIPYRFSFLFSFVLLYMGYQAWVVRNSYKLWHMIVGCILSLGIVACCQQITNISVLLYNLIFWLLTVGIFVFIIVEKKVMAPKLVDASKRTLAKVEKRRHVLTTLMITVIMGLELVCATVNFSNHFTYVGVTNYPSGKQYTESIINYMKYRERNNPFYRVEGTRTQTLNDGALNNYHGITTFTSSANGKTSQFMDGLGFAASVGSNRYAYEMGSPVANLFLGLKYQIDRDGVAISDPYFKHVHTYGHVSLYENSKYLPLGFLAEPEITQWDAESQNNSFQQQEDLFSLATGLEGELWDMIPNGCMSISSEGMELVTKNEATGYCYRDPGDVGTIRYAYTMHKSGLLCMDLNVRNDSLIRFYKEEKELFSDRYNMPQNLAVCEVAAGDIVELEIECRSSDRLGGITIKAGILNSDLFEQGYGVLADSTLNVTSFSNTKITGNIDCNRDGLMYTSITDNGNWIVEVDGKKVETVQIGDCMLGIPLTKGAHEISITYSNSSFHMGLIVSIVCMVIFLALVLLPHFLPKWFPELGKKKEKRAKTEAQSNPALLQEKANIVAEIPQEDTLPEENATSSEVIETESEKSQEE